MTDIILDKAARIALLVLLWQRNYQIDTAEFAHATNVGIRTAQRDVHGARVVYTRLQELLEKYSNTDPVEKRYSVDEVSGMLNLNPHHVRRLARNILSKSRQGVAFRFTEEDIEILRDRPGKRK